MLKHIISTSKNLFRKAHGAVQSVRAYIDELKEVEEREDELEEKEKELEKMIARERVKVDISVESVTKCTVAIIGLLLLAIFFYAVRDLLILLAISLFFSATIDPWVDKLEGKKIPRWLGVIIIYLLVLALVVILFSQIIPLVASQIKEIVGDLTRYFKSLYFDFTHEEYSIPLVPQAWNDWLRQVVVNLKVNELIDYSMGNVTNLRLYLQHVATGSFEAIITAGEAVGIVILFIFKFILVVFFVFFMVVDKNGIKRFFTSLFPAKYTPYIRKKTADIQYKIGAWFRGTLLLGFSMFVLALVGLLFLGVEYAFTLALLTGIADIIPYLGPFLAYIFIVPVVLNQDPVLLIWVTLLFILIQQIEGNILVPVIMQRAVGLNPIIVMVAMYIGYQFLGIIGVIIAVPLATSISLFVTDYTDWRKNHVEKK